MWAVSEWSQSRDAANSRRQVTLCSPFNRPLYVQEYRFYIVPNKAPYTLSVKLSDFTVWRHTWWKNWVNCAVLTGSSAGLRSVISSRRSHTELRSSLRESHSFLSLTADTTMASSQSTRTQHPFLAIHTEGKHRITYSFSNTTSCSTFYAFFPYFRIKLWPMWLANSKRQPCFIHHSHTQKKTHRTDKKTWKTRQETCAVQDNFQFSFSCSFFYKVRLHSLT
jgi:hypothetical protein